MIWWWAHVDAGEKLPVSICQTNEVWILRENSLPEQLTSLFPAELMMAAYVWRTGSFSVITLIWNTHTHTHTPGFQTSSKMILFSPHGSKPGPSQICQRSRRYPLEIHSWCRWNLDLLMKQLFTLRAGVDHINSTPYLDLWHLTVTLVRSTWVITGDFNLSLVQVGSIFQFVVLGPGKQKHTHTHSYQWLVCFLPSSSEFWSELTAPVWAHTPTSWFFSLGLSSDSPDLVAHPGGRRSEPGGKQVKLPLMESTVGLEPRQTCIKSMN